MLFLSPLGSYEEGLPHAALGEDVPDGAGVVLGVDPVADVLALAVELGRTPSTMLVICLGMNFSTCW